MVGDFEDFLAKRRHVKDFKGAHERDVKAFVAHLAKDGRNTFDDIIGLLRYSRFAGNSDVEIALLVLLDGGNVLQKFCDDFKREYGRRAYDEIIGDYEPPPIGTPPKRMPKATSDLLRRLESGIGHEATRALLSHSPHAGPPEAYADDRKMLRGSRNVDEYLRKRHEKFVDDLRGYMKSGTLFFTQKIDQDVLDFVKNNPEIGGGVRKGNTIYCMKIPYMSIEYLREKDKTLKRYYYCHCPLARESIVSGEKMSRNLCYCSSGYEKAPFEAAFGEPVKTEVLESVLWGDLVCRFALEIPERHRME